MVDWASHKVCSQLAAGYTPHELASAGTTIVAHGHALILTDQIGHDHGWVLDVPGVLYLGALT